MIAARDCVELSDFSSLIDLLRSHTGGKEVIMIEVVAAAESGGSIVCKTAGSGATARTYSVATGSKLELQARTIDSVTDVTKVRVFWA
jgi:hypothetical protein